MTYWEERRKRLDASMAKDEKRLFAKLATYYDREAARLDREIAAYYAKYGEQDVIAYRVLLQNLSDADRQLLLERMDAFGEKYPEYAHLLPVRTSIYKLNRLEGLRQSIAMQQLLCPDLGKPSKACPNIANRFCQRIHSWRLLPAHQSDDAAEASECFQIQYGTAGFHGRYLFSSRIQHDAVLPVL